jgi:predicted dehydrogenase
METLKLGFIGAGGIARSNHLPNLAKIEGVKVVAVANRSRESGTAVAKDFGIPDVMDDWKALIARPDLDAIFIGTWPYMHKEMSIAALDAGKHVFCQARMAMNLAEALEMLAAASRHPNLVNMICPPPQRMPFEPYVKQLLANGELGAITAVELRAVNGGNRDASKVHWREKTEFSGNQIMAMGIFAETLNAWVGPYQELSARLSTPIATKNDHGKNVAIKVPQLVTITGKLANGALATEIHTGLAADTTTPGSELIIWGINGTLRYRFGDVIEFAKPGAALAPASVPENLKRGWKVEEDFVTAVHAAKAGKTWKVSPDFEEGLLYMQKVEAVHASAREGRSVKLDSL